MGTPRDSCCRLQLPAQVLECCIYCSRGVATLSAEFFISASTDLESTPLCFSSSLSTDDDASYNFCMQGTNTSTSTDTATFTSVSGSGYGASPLAAYLSPYEMPQSLKCFYNTPYTFPNMTGTNASAASFKGLLEGLDSTTLESIFPNGSTSHNYYPFSILLVGCCTVAVVMRVKDSARNDTRVSPEQQGGSNNYGNVGAASTGVYYARRNRSNRSQAKYLST